MIHPGPHTGGGWGGTGDQSSAGPAGFPLKTEGGGAADAAQQMGRGPVSPGHTSCVRAWMNLAYCVLATMNGEPGGIRK